MKHQIYFRMLVLIALLLSNTVFFTSCQKTNETQTFNNVFNTSNIQTFNDLMQNSSTLSDMPDDFKVFDFSVADAVNNIQVSELISSLEQNIKLSSSEIDLLLQNDITTYENVIARISTLQVPSEVLNVAFTELQNSSLTKYLLIQKQDLSQYYNDDYYNSIIELQRYMKDFVIQPLRNFNTLVKNTDALKSAATDKDKDKKTKSACVVVILKNKKDMDDKYEKKAKEEKEKKHKGSKGNNGNHNGRD